MAQKDILAQEDLEITAVTAGAAVGGLPFLFLATFAGVFIDRINKQKLLIITQIFEAIFATILGFLVISNQINLTLVILLAFASGVVGSFDLPARFAFIVEMIGKRDLASAVSLNAGIFNAARFIGPTIAGIIIATLGTGWAFIFNGVSFLPGIWAVAVIKPVLAQKPQINVHPFQSLKDGLNFILG